MSNARKAGRRRKGEQLRVPICFSVDPFIITLASQLRANGCNLSSVVEDAILQQHARTFGEF